MFASLYEFVLHCIVTNQSFCRQKDKRTDRKYCKRHGLNASETITRKLDKFNTVLKFYILFLKQTQDLHDSTIKGLLTDSNGITSTFFLSQPKNKPYITKPWYISSSFIVTEFYKVETVLKRKNNSRIFQI